MEEMLPEILAGQTALAQRVGALERRPAPKAAAGVLDLGEEEPRMSAADRKLVEEIRRAAPGPRNGPRLQAEVPRYEPLRRAPATPPPSQEDLGSMVPRALAALEAIAAGRPAQTPATPEASSKMFKLAGAQGRVAQAYLNERYEDDPSSVVREFEKSVRVLAGTPDPSLAAQTLQSPLPLQAVWRDHVPARNHHLVARVGEALGEVYLNLRMGRVDHGMARIALLIASLEQSVQDNGRWEARAETLLGMPPCPLHLYKTITHPKAVGDTPAPLGVQALLCSPQRATTALQVYKDNRAT